MIYSAKHANRADIKALGSRKPVYATDNLESFHDVVVEKPWGSEYLLFENSDVAVWVLEIEPGQQTSMHCHPDKNTSLIVLGGNAVCKTIEREITLSPGEGIYIGKKVFHQSANRTGKSLLMMEIESPVDKFDLVRLEDGYGRIDSGYEGTESCVHKANLTFASELKKSPSKCCHIGESAVTIGYAETLYELEVLLQDIEHATLSILDRHVWTSEGEKFYEVGQAFKFGASTPPDNLNINTGFHYLLISGKK